MPANGGDDFALTAGGKAGSADGGNGGTTNGGNGGTANRGNGGMQETEEILLEEQAVRVEVLHL